MKPRTPAQLEASRANGSRSRGPKTPEGKARSSRNRTTHGLLAKTVVLEGESATRFSNLLAGLIAEHQPQTTTETGLVETMAVNRWRQMRLWGMEKAGITNQLRKQAATQPPSRAPNPDLAGNACPDVGSDGAPNGASNDPPTRTMLAVSAMNDNRSLDYLLRYEGRFSRQFDRALHTLERLRDRRRVPGESALPQLRLEEN